MKLLLFLKALLVLSFVVYATLVMLSFLKEFFSKSSSREQEAKEKKDTVSGL